MLLALTVGVLLVRYVQPPAQSYGSLPVGVLVSRVMAAGPGHRPGLQLETEMQGDDAVRPILVAIVKYRFPNASFPSPFRIQARP